MTRTFAIAALCVLPSLTSAQTDLETDLAATFAPVAIAETIVDTLTCTALYRAMSLLLSHESEMAATFREREGHMASLSGMLWVDAPANAGQTADQVFEILLPPINAATEHYLRYMDALAANTEAPFDDAIIDSVEFCNGIYAELQEPPSE